MTNVNHPPQSLYFQYLEDLNSTQYPIYKYFSHPVDKTVDLLLGYS